MRFRKRIAGIGLGIVLASVLTAPASVLSMTEPVPVVKIRLLADESLTQLNVHADGGLRLDGALVGSHLHVQAAGRRLRINSDGGPSWQASNIFLLAQRGPEMELESGSIRRTTMGVLKVSIHQGRLRLINTLPTEAYLLGVVEPELGSLDRPADSIKAQLVASRSYVISMRGRHGHEGFDFCDTPHCQVFGGTVNRQSPLAAIGASVQGQYLVYAGRVIPAFYHDSCGGMTASADQVWPVRSLPYLTTVQDGPKDAYCRFSPRAKWDYTLSRPVLRSWLSRAHLIPEGFAVQDIRVVARDSSNRVKSIQIVGPRVITVSGQRFRLAINRFAGHEVVMSTLYSVQRHGDGWTVKGRGWGHGVGLCQWGAIEMAKEGHSYRQILSHYFPGTGLATTPTPVYAEAERTGA